MPVSELDVAISVLKSSVLNEFGDARDMSTQDFIENYCQIESKDDPRSPVIPFKMWPSQKQALKEIEEHRLNIVLKARQLGLTWLVLCYLVHQVLKYSGYSAFVLSQTEQKSKELIDRLYLIFDHLPKWLIISWDEVKAREGELGKGTYKGLYFSKSAMSITIHGRGRPSQIKVQPATEGAGRSVTGDIFFFDEWAYHRFASEIYRAAFPTINRVTSGKFIGISTNQRGSYFEDVWLNAEKKDFHKIFLPWNADPTRTDEWYERSVMALGSSVFAEYPATEQDALSGGNDAAFPEFRDEIHVVPTFTPKGWWRKWASVDPGHNDPFAWYKFAVDEDGIVYIYYELTRDRSDPRLSHSEQARIFANDMYYVDDDGNMKAEKLDCLVCGRDAWTGSQSRGSDKTLIDFYREGGLDLGFVPCNNDRKLRKAVWHEYLRPIIDINAEVDEVTDKPKYSAKIQIMDCCEKLIDEMKKLVVDPYKPEAVRDHDDDHYDAAGYGLLFYHAERSEEPSSQRLTEIQIDKYRIRKHQQRLGRMATWR